jgi:gluconolactonase
MRVSPSFLSAALAGLTAFVVLPLIGTLPSPAAEEPATYAPRVRSGTIGRIERLSPALDSLLDRDARIEVLAEGFDWSEGPVWFAPGGYLLFSDVPRNVVWRWRESDGLLEYLRPSGYTAAEIVPNTSGSNGLTLDNEGRLILCQHGDRQVARLKGRNRFEPLATNFEGKRFNSPNDIAIRSNGELYFTDPPYGLPKGADDPARELPFQGVFRISQRGRVTLLVRDLTRPNGIAFSPDEKKLYVAVSDPERAHYMVYDVERDGTLDQGRILFDATPLVPGRKGLPDGIKVDARGNLWATGPGGVLILDPDGRHLGTIDPGEAAANCAWGNDGSVLYITADTYLCRVRTRTRGPMPGPLEERRGRTPRPGFRN